MEQKRSFILDQVSNLYHRYGIKSVTMDDVASHIGISKKTLYENFTDKEDLVRQVLLLEQDSRCNFLNAIERKKLNAIEELFEVYKMIRGMYRDYNPSMEYDLQKYYPDLCVRIKDFRRKRLYGSIHDNLLKGKKEGFFRKELNAKTIARIQVFWSESFLNNDMFTFEEITSFALFHEIFIYHLQGILSEKGRSFFEQNFEKFKDSL